MSYTIDDYRNAPSGIGPLAAEWKDKPHRLIYDLCNLLEKPARCPPKIKQYLATRRQEEAERAAGHMEEAHRRGLAAGRLWQAMTPKERRQVNRFI